MSCWYAAASSSGFSSSRWTFSTIACWSIDASSAARTIAGIVWSPTRRAARQRRSPAMSSKPSPPARARAPAAARRPRGSTRPAPPSDSSSKCSRGCCGFGRIDGGRDLLRARPSSFETTPGRDQRTEPSTQPSGSRHGSPPSPARGTRRRPRDVESNTMIGCAERRRLRDPHRPRHDRAVHLRRRSARGPRARPASASLVRASYIVSTMPRTSSVGLRFDFTSATLRSSWPRPSSA